MTDRPAREAYESVDALPSVIEMRKMLHGFKVLGWVGGRKFRRQAKDLEATLNEITETVEGFYRALGGRGWIFHDDLRPDDMRDVANCTDAESAELRLIDYYRSGDHIQSSLRRLGHHAAMRPRLELAQLALHDYQQGRYYSCVLVLLAVMDGFVNDFEPATRKGLHARDSDDMSAWDRAAGHHQGLTQVHRVYNQRVSKLDETEQVAIRRNGLVHGMLPNFNNVVLATKAWNLLFAVSDWADGEVARQKPIEDEPTLREVLRRYVDLQAVKKKSDEFASYEVENENQLLELREHAMIETFFEQWSKQRWGLVGGHFIRFGTQPRNVGDQAKEARNLYEDHLLQSWRVIRVCRKTSSLALVDADLVVNGAERRATVRLVLCDDQNDIELDPDRGEWFVAPYFPESFWSRADEHDPDL